MAASSTTSSRSARSAARGEGSGSGAAWVSVVVLADALMPHGVGNDPNDTAKVRLVALQYATSGQGYHGDSARLRFSSTNHANGTLYSVTTTGDHVVAGKVAIKGWDNTVPS